MIIDCALFIEGCALARRVDIEVAFVAFCSIVVDIQQSHRGFVCALKKKYLDLVVRLSSAQQRLLAGRVFVDVNLQQVCQTLLVQFVGQK